MVDELAKLEADLESGGAEGEEGKAEIRRKLGEGVERVKGLKRKVSDAS